MSSIASSRERTLSGMRRANTEMADSTSSYPPTGE
jgi:hypothetical protein